MLFYNCSWGMSTDSKEKRCFRHDSTRNVQRRVRTSSYEYSEDRGLEVGSQPTRTMKLSKGLMESLLFKLFYLMFMAMLLPVKTLEFTFGKIFWIFRCVCLQIATFLLKILRFNYFLELSGVYPENCSLWHSF